MSVIAGIERPYAGSFLNTEASQVLPPGPVAAFAAGLSANNNQPTVFNLFPAQITTALTAVTTQITCIGLNLPKNLPVYGAGLYVGTQGTNTGWWYALCDQGGTVRAVSANTIPAGGSAYTNLSLLPANNIPYTTPYAGLYYLAWGVVTSAAGTVGATAAQLAAAVNAGAPIILATSGTAATTTPPAVGSAIGTLTAYAGGTPYCALF